jgi:molecular chaperone DnaK
MSIELDPVGIDHGTTNSAIAVMTPQGPKILNPNEVDRVMPSAVYITSRGDERIGRDAYYAILTEEPNVGDGHTGYKTQIGQNDLYEFHASRQVKSARQLGGMVIRALVTLYQTRMNKELRACVVTVPAKFEHSAVEGTREAARLAGLKHFELLQEPIAASLAYGFEPRGDRGQWMVFDLGGGTLDVSLVQVRQGKMSVPEHGHAGDNFLGGRNFDRELMDYAVQHLRKEYALGAFAQQNPQYRSAWGRLMLAVEQAKIILSDKNEAVIEVHGVLCKDERGKPVKVDIPITRQAYERMISPKIERAVHLCENLLNVNRMTRKDVDRLILVGGPTKTPYIQRVLQERLQIPLDCSIDPMCAVALGAAVRALTVEWPDEVTGRSVASETRTANLTVKLQFERHSKVPTHLVTGQIEGAHLPAGLRVEITRHNVPWSSGRLTVDETGYFEIDVPLIDLKKPHESLFQTIVYDASGTALVTVNDPKIWYPIPEAKPRLSNSMRVGLVGNETEILIKQGVELPHKSQKKTVNTASTVRKGVKGDEVRIPIIESVLNMFGIEDNHADCGVHVGTLHIEATDNRITRDIPEGSPIDLTLRVGQSQEYEVKAYIPLLEEEFRAEFTTEGFNVETDDVSKRFNELKVMLDEARRLNAERPDPVVTRCLKIIEDQQTVDGISKELERAKAGERHALYGAHKRTLEFAGGMNVVREAQRIPRLQKQIERLGAACNAEERRDLDSIRAEMNKALESKNAAALSQLEEHLEDLDRKVRGRPLHELLLDLCALSGKRVSAAQHDAFNRASALYDRIEAKGGRETATPADLAEAESMHRELERLYPELYQWRSEFLASLGDMDLTKFDRSTVTRGG